ncbi:MAG: glycosyltransferase family 4 protein [Saprospiraceae bacterium]
MTTTNPLYKILVISDYREITSSRPEAEILVGLAKIGHGITILSYPDAEYYNNRFRSHGIQVIEKHPTKKASPSYIRFLRHLVQEEDFDFVHAFNSLGLTNAVWALMGLKSKLIAYRGYAGQTHWYDPMMYLKYFHPRVDQILCLSRETYDILARNMPGGNKKLTVMVKGHDPEWFKNVVPIDRSTLGFTKDDILVCSVANVRPFKGIPYLINACRDLTNTSGIQLLLIGNGFEDEPVHSMIMESPFSKNIHRLGYRKDNLAIVAACDASVLASTHGEALTKSLIESMCLGIPAIITDIPGNKGLIVDGQSGWIVPPRDPVSLSKAIIDIAQNPAERKRRGENAKENIRLHFHTDNTVKAMIEVYDKLI